MDWQERDARRLVLAQQMEQALAAYWRAIHSTYPDSADMAFRKSRHANVDCERSRVEYYEAMRRYYDHCAGAWV